MLGGLSLSKAQMVFGRLGNASEEDGVKEGATSDLDHMGAGETQRIIHESLHTT
jgi:hypothetical protein